jgi:hypothetical protein
MGSLQRVVFPYAFLFRQINTHLLADTPLTGAYETDRQLVLNALARGHCFVGYDGATPTRGFRFTAHCDKGNMLMGDEIVNRNGVTMQIAVPTYPGQPRRASASARKDTAHVCIRLLRNGLELAQWENQTNITYIVPPLEAGVFRVEVRLRYQGQMRGWIYSNPVYLRTS